MPANAGKRWSREELIVAFNLYCRTPFGRIHTGNPEIIELAGLLRRTPSSVSYKLANLARLDPALQERGIRGASHGAKADIGVWEEFAAQGEALALESERLLASLTGNDLEDSIDTSDVQDLEGTEREAIVRTRVNQSFFRRMILARYENECCITGVAAPQLLVASHIVPWAASTEHRMNPRNGLSLNALHDRAFDRGLITVTDDFRVRVSTRIREAEPSIDAGLLVASENQPLRLHGGFSPDPELLAYHRENIFEG